MEKLFSIIASPLSFVILISIVIAVHELGHYWVGRWFNAAAESFALGFGKPVFERKDKRGTRWRLNWLPLGGFVKFAGEMQTPQDATSTSGGSDDDNLATQDFSERGLVGRPFTDLNPWQRLAIALGGPFANFLFSITVFAGLAITLGVPTSQAVRVEAVQIGMPGEAAGFEVGDIIVKADGRKATIPADVMRATMLSAEQPVEYEILRGDQELTLTAVPEKFMKRDEALKTTTEVGRVGVELRPMNYEVRKLNPIDAVVHGTESVGLALGDTMKVIGRLVTRFEGVDKLSGPVGIFNLSDNVTDFQMQRADTSYWDRLLAAGISLIELAALLSIGVAFFNLLPIPVLDGGAALLCVAEGVTGKPVPEAVHRAGLTVGLFCLVGFAIVVTWFDISRLLAA